MTMQSISICTRISNMAQQARFSGAEGKDYNLATKAFPYCAMSQRVVRKELTKHFDNSQKKSLLVLELGCGTGITSEQILQADPRIKLLALDNEKVMLDQTQTRLWKYKLALWHKDALYFCEHIHTTSPFNAIVSANMIHNLPKDYRAQLLKAAYSRLCPGGIFIEADKIAPDDARKHQRDYEWQLKHLELFDKMGRHDLREVWAAHYQRDNQEDLILRESELVSGLQEAGFSDVKKVFRKRMEAVYVARK